MRRLLYSFLATFIMGTAYAQQDSIAVAYDKTPLNLRHISDDDLQKYRNDPDFNYEIVNSDPSWWDDLKTWAGNVLLRLFEAIFGVERATGLLATFLKIVPYLLLVLLVYLLIKFFLKVNASNHRQARKSGNSVLLSEEEHIIRNEDIQKLIQEAVNDKNFRLAVRYYYLHILKLLSEKELIAWELQKTNSDYLKEIKGIDLRRQFSEITHLYDYIWYGDFPIDENRYHKAENAFLNLQKSVKANA
ncbi:DUF4129 domain-containing protein [Pseudozobellia thermophila]|uniref:Protein-glutamine gamma-glutamyltransferase-like C-terminal domain-containing protein n=1 Tax=Pseudozobellia thermophila TaxID=192903 RepID=A0A1M6MK90_9FLAO|nr:DUF4129 domain-containing protein [Pseudozobellia thermophila]SHJ83901.1 protein of unknown function [Pseudozobellia thermophila]